MTRNQALYVLKKHKLVVNPKTTSTKWLITAAEWYDGRTFRRAQTRTGSNR